MNLYVPGVLKTWLNCVPLASLPLVLLKVSGPETTSMLWPPSTTFQVTASPALMEDVVFDGSCQSMVAGAAWAAGAAMSATVNSDAVRAAARGWRIGSPLSVSVPAERDVPRTGKADAHDRSNMRPEVSTRGPRTD